MRFCPCSSPGDGPAPWPDPCTLAWPLHPAHRGSFATHAPAPPHARRRYCRRGPHFRAGRQLGGQGGALQGPARAVPVRRTYPPLLPPRRPALVALHTALHTRPCTRCLAHARPPCGPCPGVREDDMHFCCLPLESGPGSGPAADGFPHEIADRHQRLHAPAHVHTHAWTRSIPPCSPSLNLAAAPVTSFLKKAPPPARVHSQPTQAPTNTAPLPPKTTTLQRVPGGAAGGRGRLHRRAGGRRDRAAHHHGPGHQGEPRPSQWACYEGGGGAVTLPSLCRENALALCPFWPPQLAHPPPCWNPILAHRRRRLPWRRRSRRRRTGEGTVPRRFCSLWLRTSDLAGGTNRLPPQRRPPCSRLLREEFTSGRLEAAASPAEVLSDLVDKVRRGGGGGVR